MSLNPAEYAKAIAGAVVTGLGILYMALDNDVVTAQEWVGVVQGSIAAFATVWGIPNAAKTVLAKRQTVTVTNTDVIDPPGPDHRAVNGL